MAETSSRRSTLPAASSLCCYELLEGTLLWVVAYVQQSPALKKFVMAIIFMKKNLGVSKRLTNIVLFSCVMF